MQGVLNVKTSLCSAALAAAVLACGFAASPVLGQTGGTAVAVIDVPYIFKNHIWTKHGFLNSCKQTTI